MGILTVIMDGAPKIRDSHVMSWYLANASSSSVSNSGGDFPSHEDFPERSQVAPTNTPRATLLTLLIFLPYLVQAVIYVRDLIQCVSVRNDLDTQEGVIVYAFLTSFHTGRIYSPPFTFPFNTQMYGPVLYLIGALLAAVAHGDPTMTTMLGRLLSFTAYLGSVAMVGYLCWKLENRQRWAWISVILGLSCAWAVPFAACTRPDTLSILLIIAALVLYDAAKDRIWFVFLAGIVGSLAYLTKQSTALMLVALALDGLISRRFWKTAALIAGGVPVPALIFAVLWLRHEPFLVNFTMATHAILDWPSTVPVAIGFIRTNEMAIIPICIAALGAGLAWRKNKYRAILLVVILGCLSNLAALSITGGVQNYWILPWLLLLLLVPAGLGRIEQWAARSPWIPLGLLALGTSLLIHQRNLLTMQLLVNLDASSLANVTMLSDSPYLEMRSREPQMLDPFFYNQLRRQKIWSDAPILQQLDREAYDLLLIGGEDGDIDSEFVVRGFRGTSFWSPDLLHEMTVYYRPLCELPGWIALIPRNRFDSVQAVDLVSIFHEPCRATERTLQLGAGMH